MFDANDSHSAADPFRSETRQQIADLIRRLRQVADQITPDRTAQDDLKLLSQTLRELRRAFTVFAPYRAHRKLTIFGSARTPRNAPTYVQAESLGRAMSEFGWFVVTGASTGIMEAGHRGAGRERSMGLNIMLPFEQGSNEIISGDSKLVTMKYFFTRKLMFVKECDAVVCLPGGFGTLDEAFEVLTLLQTGKRELVPLVFLDAPSGTFWRDWLAYIKTNLLAGGMISPEDLSLFKVTDRLDEAVAEINGFYRIFHSMEYVPPNLALRITEPLPPADLGLIQRNFADIVTEGRIVQQGPLNGESSRPDLSTLPRLVFRFNRRSLGRLRQLIDRLNRGAP